MSRFKSHNVSINDRIVTISRNCSVTNQNYSVQLSWIQYIKYIHELDYINNFLKGFTSEQKEFLLSDITPEEYKMYVHEQFY